MCDLVNEVEIISLALSAITVNPPSFRVVDDQTKGVDQGMVVM